jgi:hypothetical protein
VKHIYDLGKRVPRFIRKCNINLYILGVIMYFNFTVYPNNFILPIALYLYDVRFTKQFRIHDTILF